MQTLAQLESKILGLQSQIQATQDQITDYQTNPIHIKQAWGCRFCGTLVYYNEEANFCENPMCAGNATFYYAPFFSKVQELAQAQTTLATLQNELKTTQEQYKQAKDNRKNHAMILAQALLSAPPPYKIQSSAKAISAIESLKRYLSTMSENL